MYRRTNMVLSARAFFGFLTRASRTASFKSQVTRPVLSHFPPSSLLKNDPVFHRFPQIMLFSSIPDMGSSEITYPETENLLEDSGLKLTHESVIYALKKLEKNPQKALDFFKWVSEKKESTISPAAYSLILRILGRKEWMKEFWAFIRDMTPKGYEIDKETYEALLSNLGHLKMGTEVSLLRQLYTKMVQERASDANVIATVKVILEFDWGDEVKKKLEEIKFSISDRTVLKVLRDVRWYPFKALGFFRWVPEFSSDYKHNSVTYNAMLRVLARDESIEEFWNIVKEMKSEGYEIDIDTYVKILREFRERKMAKEAVELYEMMLAGPYKPSVQDCTVLLGIISLSETPDLDMVYRVVKNFEASGCTLSKAVYDGIHRSLTRGGRFDEAEKILETMKDAGFEPDNITHSQMVFGLCKFGRLEEACKVLDDMEVQGCVPDIKTWTILIQGHCQAGEVDKAFICFTKMIEKSCEADADLLSVMVNGLISTKRMLSAYNLVVEMVKRAHLRPWQATYKTIIEKLLERGMLEEALKVLGLMKSHNYPPYADPFVKYIAKLGTVADVTEFLKISSVKRSPSSHSYKNVIEAFLKEGRDSEAQDLLRKCPHHVRSHADIRNLVIRKLEMPLDLVYVGAFVVNSF